MEPERLVGLRLVCSGLRGSRGTAGRCCGQYVREILPRSQRNAVLGKEHSLEPLGLSCFARAIRAQTHLMHARLRGPMFQHRRAPHDVGRHRIHLRSDQRADSRASPVANWGHAVSIGDTAAHAMGVQWHLYCRVPHCARLISCGRHEPQRQHFAVSCRLNAALYNL